MLLSLTLTVYIMMYFFMYAAAIKLRYKHPEVHRSFLIPGGKAGIWLIGGWGFLAMVFLFILSLIPPSQISFTGMSTWHYVLFMIGGTAAVVAIPLIIYRFRKPSWKLTDGDTRLF